MEIMHDPDGYWLAIGPAGPEHFTKYDRLFAGAITSTILALFEGSEVPAEILARLEAQAAE